MTRSRRRFLTTAAAAAAVALASATAVIAAPKVIRPPQASTTPAAAAPAPASVKGQAAKPGAGTKVLSLPSRRPIVLDALHVEGKTDAPRVLFVHAGPTVALEAAPAHPSYLRDDFTAALSSPVRVRVRAGEMARPTTAGGNR